MWKFYNSLSEEQKKEYDSLSYSQRVKFRSLYLYGKTPHQLLSKNNKSKMNKEEFIAAFGEEKYNAYRQKRSEIERKRRAKLSVEKKREMHNKNKKYNKSWNELSEEQKKRYKERAKERAKERKLERMTPEQKSKRDYIQRKKAGLLTAEELEIESKKIEERKRREYEKNRERYYRKTGGRKDKPSEPKQKSKESVYKKNRRHRDSNYKLFMRMRTKVWKAFNHGYKDEHQPFDIFGISHEDLIREIKNEDWQRLERSGVKMELDHIVPMAAVMDNKELLLKANHHQNLKGLPFALNRLKHDRFIAFDKDGNRLTAHEAIERGIFKNGWMYTLTDVYWNDYERLMKKYYNTIPIRYSIEEYRNEIMKGYL